MTVLHPSTPRLFFGTLIMLNMFLVLWPSSVAGADDSRQYIWDIAKPEGSFPDWLRELPVPRGLEGGRRDFQIIPPRLGGNLAITLFFDEPEEGELRVLWRNADHGRILTPNLFEGTGLPNQRTIVLRDNLLYRPGVLSLFCSEPELPVWRVQFQWLMPRMVLVPSGTLDTGPDVFMPDGEIISGAEIPITRQIPESDQWKNDAFTAVLSVEPQRLDEGVEFVFDLGDIPAVSLLRLEMAGAPLEGTVWVWLNGKAAVPLHLALPELIDGGFRAPAALDGPVTYTGWRTGSAYIPPRLLKSGENTLHLQFLDPLAQEVRPESLARNVVLNLTFPPEPGESDDPPAPQLPAEDNSPALAADSPELPVDFSGSFFQQYSQLGSGPTPFPAPSPSLVPIPGADGLAPPNAPETPPPGEFRPPVFLPDASSADMEDSLRLFLPDLAPALGEFLSPQ